MCIAKAISIKLADDIGFIITMQYHAKRDPSDTSVYRYIGRVFKISEARQKQAWCFRDENSLGPWKWPNDPTWSGKIYTDESTNYRQGKWIAMKLRKLETWEDGVEHIKGYEKCHKDYNHNSAMETEGYTAEDGSIISILDKEALLARVGQNVYKIFGKKTKSEKSDEDSNLSTPLVKETKVEAKPESEDVVKTEQPQEKIFEVA